MTATYRIEVSPAAERDWRKLTPQVRARLEPAILALEQDPRPPGCRKLSEPLQGFRIRVGDYRVVYTVDDAAFTVTLLKIAHRDEAYR